MIPKIIHQTWRSETLPTLFQKLYDENKKINNDFEFKLWSHSPGRPDIDDFIKKEFPDLFPVFSNSKMGVQKADIARIAILYHYGGIYFDLDILNIKNLGDLLDFNTNYAYFAMEPKEQTLKLMKKRDVLCNAFIVVPPKHPLLEEALNKIKIMYSKHGDKIYNVFNVFGSDLFASCMESDELFQKCKFINRNLVYPINDPKFDDIKTSEYETLMLKNGKYDNDVYMIHYWIHSDFESKELLETFPYEDNIDIHQNIYNFFKRLYPRHKYLSK